MTTKTRTVGFARNVSAGWIAFAFVAGVSFFLSPFIVHKLGNTAYGVWTLLAALVGYLGLLDFGVRGAVTRYLAHHHAADDSKGASSVVSTGLVMFGILGLLAIVLAAGVAYLSPFLFNVPASMVHDTRLVLIVGGMTVASTLVGAVFGGVISGLERFDIINGIEIVITALRAIAIVLLLSQGHGLVALALIHLAGSLLSGLAAWTVARRLYPVLHLDLRIASMSQMRKILSFSVWSSAIHIFASLIYYSSVVIIAVFLPVAMATFFAIAGSLCDYARQLASSVSVLMTPRVSALNASGSHRVVDEIVGAARLATLITASIALIFWFRGESFINLWMGPEYGPASGEVLRILALVVLFSGARTVATASIMGVNKHRTLAPIYGAEAACNLALSVALVGPFGLAGVALGTLIPSLFVSLVMIPRRLAATTGVPTKRFYRHAWLLPTLACVPFALVNMALERLLPAPNLALFFLQIALTLPLAGVGAMVLCLTPDERRVFGSTLRKVVVSAR